jgi:hypothetical protein
MTKDGLLVTVAVDPPTGSESLGLYRHAEDIAMPMPAKATIGDLNWLADAWVGTKSTGSSIEERWSPQPGGQKATEFVLSELSPTLAVFENPRHDYPRRIAYELSAEGVLTTTVGQTKGGTPLRIEFKRENK